MRLFEPLSPLPGLLVVLAIAGTSSPAGSESGAGLRLNELQVIGTHNSYHRETSEREQDAYDTLISTPGGYDATCVQLVTCLRQVRDWSRAHPAHVPIPIMLELKDGDDRAVALGGAAARGWDRDALDTLDAEIRSVFEAGEMITPADVRPPGETLERSVLDHGWPRLRDSRGQVLFLPPVAAAGSRAAAEWALATCTWPSLRLQWPHPSNLGPCRR